MRRWNSKLERNVAQQIARCMERRRRAAAETINQKPPAPRVPPCLRFSSSLFARRMQIALTLMVNDATVQGKKEASSEELSATFRTFYLYALNARTRTNRSAKAVRTDVLNCVQTNHFSTIDVRKHSCVMLRRVLGNSIYVTVVLLSMYVVLRRGLVVECLMNNKVLLSPSFFILCIFKKSYIFSG